MTRASNGTQVHRLPIAYPGDVSGLHAAVAAGTLDPAEVVAVFGKTEGNGCVNDFTRGCMAGAVNRFFAEHLGPGLAGRIALVMSGGTEGVLSPHLTVLTRGRAGSPGDGTARLSVGVARTPAIPPTALGRDGQREATAVGVREAMSHAGIIDPGAVHYVQVKCPLLTNERIETSDERLVTDDTYKSMAYARGASALGVASALGEIDGAVVADEAVLRDFDRYSAVASVSAGGELDHCEVVVLGNAPDVGGDLVIDHAVMADAIDRHAVATALGDDLAALVQVFAKAEADPRGRIRGRRHTMIDDSDINHTRHARAVVGGVIASMTGDPMIYVSGGAEHQGPPGGGVCAVIRRVSPKDT